MSRGLIAILACAPLLFAPASRAFVRSTTGAPNYLPLRWFSGPIPFLIDAHGSRDAAPELVFAAVRKGFAAWELGCSAMRFRDDGVRAGLRAEYVPGGANANAIRWAEDAWSGPASQLAYTTVTFSPATGEILDADISFNGHDYAFSAEAAGVPGKADVQAIATHEAGHVLGLDHTLVPGATMRADIGVGQTFARELKQDDRDGVCAIYPSVQRTLPPAEGGCQTPPRSEASDPSVALLVLALALVVLKRRPIPRRG